jgi:hypothetical protein
VRHNQIVNNHPAKNPRFAHFRSGLKSSLFSPCQIRSFFARQPQVSPLQYCTDNSRLANLGTQFAQRFNKNLVDLSEKEN